MKPTSTAASTARQRTSSARSRMAPPLVEVHDRRGPFGVVGERRRNSHRASTRKTAISTTTIGARLTRKSLNDRPARLAMMMFGGSPIRVAVPPMLMAIASAIR